MECHSVKLKNKRNINETKIMVSGTKKKASRSKTYPCAMCGKKIIPCCVPIVNAWVHKKSTKKSYQQLKLKVLYAQDVVV